MHHIRNYFHPQSRATKISHDARILMISILLWQIVTPVLGAFTHAFLWRSTESLLSVAMYALGFFIMLPGGFILVGYLFRFIALSHLYGVSMILQSVVVLLLVIISPDSHSTIFILGLLLGGTSGVYWGARNFLELELTNDHNRNYYFGTMISLRSVISIIMPFVIGWFLVDSPFIYNKTIEDMYLILAGCTFILSLLIYTTTYHFSFDVHKKIPLLLHKPVDGWKNMRWFAFFEGLSTGRHFYVPALIVLYLIGNEEILGLFESISAIVLSIVIYTVGRYMPEGKRLKVFGLGLLLYFIVSVVFAFSFTTAGAIFYRATFPIGLGLLWVTVNPMRLEVVDRLSQDNTQHFSLLLDNEIFLNIGRIVGIGIFFAIAYAFSEASALRYIPMIAGATSIGSYYFINKVEKGIHRKMS